MIVLAAAGLCLLYVLAAIGALSVVLAVPYVIEVVRSFFWTRRG